MSVTGVYAGTFDPVTNGHMDIISRAVRIVKESVSPFQATVEELARNRERLLP